MTNKGFIELETSVNNCDWYLQSIVATATVAGTESPITLLVNGSIITGKLIGVSEYFDIYANELPYVANTQEELKYISQMKEAYSEVGKETAKEIKENYNTNKAIAIRNINYIHLKEARFVIENSLVPRRNPFLWRGKISDVNGFTFGILNMYK